MNLKKKLLTLIICSFIVIFTVSCSCGGSGAEEVKNDATVAVQAETNEKGETVTNAQTQAQAETQQDDGAVSDDDNTKEENSSNKASDKNNDKNNNSNSEKSDNSNSEKTDSTENQSEDDETVDYGEEPLYDAQAVFDEDDFEF